MEYLGRHMIVELYGCDADRASDITFAEKIMKEAAELAGMKDAIAHFYQLGMTGFVINADSYYGFRSFPESGYVGLDLYSSNEAADNKKALEFLVRKFGATKYSASEINRGNKAEV